MTGGLPSPKASDAQSHGVRQMEGRLTRTRSLFVTTAFFACKAKWTACKIFFLSCDFFGHASIIRLCTTAKCFLSVRAVGGSLSASIEIFTTSYGDKQSYDALWPSSGPRMSIIQNHSGTARVSAGV